MPVSASWAEDMTASISLLYTSTGALIGGGTAGDYGGGKDTPSAEYYTLLAARISVETDDAVGNGGADQEYNKVLVREIEEVHAEANANHIVREASDGGGGQGRRRGSGIQNKLSEGEETKWFERKYSN